MQAVSTREWVDGHLVTDKSTSYPIDGYVPGAEPEVALEPLPEPPKEKSLWGAATAMLFEAGDTLTFGWTSLGDLAQEAWQESGYAGTSVQYVGSFAARAGAEIVAFAFPPLKAVGTAVRVARAAHKIYTTALTVHGIVESAGTVVDGLAALADGRTLAGVGLVALGMVGVFPGVPGGGGKHLGVGAAKATPTPPVKIARGVEAAETVNHSAPFRTRTAQTGTFKGGPHGDTKLPWGDELESHHMPPRGTTGLHPDVGPAIQMDPIDHRLTSSHISRPESREYRREIREMIEEGRVRDALAREIRDVRRAALAGSGDATKYNAAMLEMLDYARGIGFLPH